jgi:DegV family protein with EDD domain
MKKPVKVLLISQTSNQLRCTKTIVKINKHNRSQIRDIYISPLICYDMTNKTLNIKHQSPTKNKELFMSFILITDTSSDLSLDYLKDNNIETIGLTVNIDGKDYLTSNPGEIESDWFIEQLEKGADAKTSQINVGTFHDFFEPFVKEGKTILYIALSSALSGTYNSSIQAREMLLEEYPEANIHLFDSKMAANGIAVLVDKANELRNQGKTIQEVIQILEDIAPRINAYVTVDTLHYLAKGGRISKTAATIGGIANIKPILSIDSQGALGSLTKVRGRKKSITELYNRLVADLDTGVEQTIYINYSGSDEDAHLLATRLEEGIAPKSIVINPLGPIIATHTGPGALGVFGISTKIRD